MKYQVLLFVTIFLSACSLTASLLGEGQEVIFTPTYETNGEIHALTITFTVKDGVITQLAVEPQTENREELAHQIAFGANVRQFVLGKRVEEISLPEIIGEEQRLTEIFRGVVEELRAR